MTSASSCTGPKAPARTVSFGGPSDDREVSRHELVRFQAGELSEERRAEITSLLQRDAALQSELNELEAEKRAFAASMPFERFAARHQARANAGLKGTLLEKLRALRWQLGGGALALGAAAALLVVMPQGTAEDPQQGGSSVRLKGGAQLGIFVRDQGSARLGVDGEKLHPGDQIQFVVKDATLTSMVLLGVDGNGVVTVYDARQLQDGTEKGAQPVAVQARPRVLEQSVILDDALGPERFFVVYADEDLGQLTTEAKRAARLLAQSKADLKTTERLPMSGLDARQSSIHIVKVQR